MRPSSGMNPLSTNSSTMSGARKEEAAGNCVVLKSSRHTGQHCNQKALSNYDIKVENEKGVSNADAKFSPELKKPQNASSACACACVTQPKLLHSYRQDGLWSWSDVGVRIAGRRQCLVPGCLGHIPSGAMWVNGRWV